MHDLNGIRWRSDTLKEMPRKRLGQFERLSFNVRDEQEIFSLLRPERNLDGEATRDSGSRSRQLDKFFCVMCHLYREIVTNNRGKG